jgi:hypothetical protein
MDAGEALRWMGGGAILALAWAAIPRSRRPPGVNPSTPWGPRALWGPLGADGDDRTEADPTAPDRPSTDHRPTGAPVERAGRP